MIINEALLDIFDDDLCRQFLQHCPKLANLMVHASGFFSNPPLHKIRLLLTELYLCGQEDNIEQYVTSFPRLKSIDIMGQLMTFESMLPILARLSNLQIIKLNPFENGTDKFLERHLRQKTSDEGDQLKERISQIKELEINCATVLSRYILEFIVKYTTGLKQLKIANILKNNPQEIQLCYAMGRLGSIRQPL